MSTTAGSSGSKVSRPPIVLRAAEVDGDGDADAPGTERVGDARDLREELGSEDARVGVDVVDSAAVDADGGEQAARIR